MEEKNKEVEIDLLELARKLWDNKKFIIKITLIGAVVGLVIAFSIPKEYTSTVVFTVNSNNSSTGSVGALASLAGINLNNQSSEILSPEIYPNLMNSTSFVQGLLGIEVKDIDQKVDTTLYFYLKNDQKIPWWSYIFKIPGFLVSVFKPEVEKSEKSIANPYSISDEEMGIIETLKNSYSISTNKKTGITTIELTSQSSVISAFLADTISSYLQSYIIQERTKKAQNDLENSRKLYKQYKKSYEESQQRLTSFLDRNQHIISESYRLNQKKLEIDANLAYTIYSQMAQQVQMNEIKVQDDTPVFTIIQPAIEPIYAAGPKKKVILGVFILISAIIASIWVLRGDLKEIIYNKEHSY